MTAMLSSNIIFDFIDSSAFGYFLHAAQVIVAEFILSFSLKKRNKYILRSIISVVLYLAASTFLGLLFEKVFPYARYVVAFMLSIAVMNVCYKSKFWYILFCIAAAIAMQNLSYSASALTVTILGGDPIKSDWIFTTVQIVVYTSIHIIIYKRFYKRLKDIIDAGEEKLYIVIFSMILIFVIYMLQIGKEMPDVSYYWQWKVIFVIYDLMMLYMLLGMYDRNKLRRENAILESLRASEERQYEFDKRVIEMINLKSHNLKHQIMALRSLEGEEKEQAFKEMEEGVFLYNNIVNTDSKPIDTLLANKLLVCEKYSIRLNYIIDGNKLSFMKTLDVYSLFGNAIDNAIRAETQIQDAEKRIINVNVFAKGNILIIHIENYWDGHIEFKNGLPVSTKDDSDNHGFGLISIKRISERYGGVMSIECQNNLFCMDITIPIKNLSVS